MADAVSPPAPRGTAEPPGDSGGDGDQLAARLSRAPGVDRPGILVEQLTPRTAAASPVGWVTELAVLAEAFAFTLPQLRRTATDLAWQARRAGQRYLTEDDRVRVLAAADTDLARRTVVYVQAQRLRFDFRFAALQGRCAGWLAEFPDDALILGMAAFAALGSRASNGLDLFQRAVESPNADGKSNQVCLTGIWFADHLPEQADMLLRLSDEMMARGQADSSVHFRRAAAYRKLRRFDEALSEIDRAIDGLQAGDNLVHEQFVQERRAIVLSRDFQRQIEQSADDLAARIAERMDDKVTEASRAMEVRINEASAVLAQRVDVAQEMVSSGLIKNVEILGLFVALVGFLIGSGTVVTKAQSFGQRATAMVIVIVGTLAFFALLRLAISVRRRPKRP